ncbi:MAG: BON domain-containing protein [Burkholderiales bacterium]|nr:BON domain-containing protein [Burkholderiales bacterium]
MMKKERRRIFLLVTVAVFITFLQGCFPLFIAGVGAGALSFTDRRSTGAQIEDEAIEIKTSNRFKEQFGSAQYQVNVTSYNRRVLLTGQAASEEIKNKLTQIAQGVQNVVSVTNEVIIAGNSSVAARSNDGLITSNVKARLVTSSGGRVNANHVKVLTENGTVYLMGIVTPAEGDAAAEIARTSSGVQKVVKVFEYVDKAPELGTAAK